MSLGPVIRDALLRIDVESKKAEKEIKDFTKATDATTKSLGAVSVQAISTQKAIETIGLGAEAQVPRLQKLHDGFQGFTGKIGSGINSISKFAQSLGPWNQALELGGKVVRVAEAGLDAYAKTSEAAAAQVKALTDEVNSYKAAVLETVGATTVAILGALPPIEKMGATWNKARNDQEVFFENFKKRWNEAEWQDFLRTFGDSALGGAGGAGGLGARLGGAALGAAPGSLDTNKLSVSLTILNRELGESKTKFDAFTAAQKKARDEASAFRTQIAALSGKGLKESTDALLAELEGTPTSLVDLNGGSFEGLGAFGLPPDKLSGQLDFKKALQGQLGAYESDGFVDEMAKYSGALNTFADAASTAYETIASGSGSVLQAIKSMAQAQLLGLGKLEVVEAIRQLGLGFGSLANPLFAGEAALHFKSAATHGAAAAAAGLGIAALGAIGGGGGGSSPAGASASAGAYASGGGGTRPVTTTQTIYIVQGDSFSEDSPRIRQRKAERVVALGTARATSVTGDF